jgi:outer membrane protein insertion porin family
VHSLCHSLERIAFMQVNFSLPGESLQRMGLHGHMFADTGSIARLFGKEQTVSDGFSRFWNEWRLSVGAGIRIPFTAQGFFELNFVQTLKKFGDDLPAPGLQFGFAAEPYTPIPARLL